MSLITLEGKRGLVVGIANDSSIAYGCAKAFRALGAELAVTYLNAKAERHVKPLADELEASLFLPLDVRNEGELEAVFAAIQEKWGKIDFVLHSIAFAPKEDLHARVVDSSQEGFLLAMDVSCHSFVRMAKLAEPLMTDGGLPADRNVLRRRKGGRALQSDGAGQGGAGKRDPLHGSRTWR